MSNTVSKETLYNINVQIAGLESYEIPSIEKVSYDLLLNTAKEYPNICSEYGVEV